MENIVFLINLANTATDFETLRSVLASIQYQIDTIQCFIKENEENNQTDYSMKERTLEEIFNLDPEQLTNSDWIEVLLELNKSKLICNLKLEEMMLRLNTMSSIEPEITFISVMGNQVTRKYFNDFLEISGCQSLLGLWGAVEELRLAERDLWHQLATQIFYTYVNRPVAALQLDKSVLRRIESFLVGDSGPDVFFDIQEEALTILENEHYTGFSQSEFFSNMILECKEMDFKS